MSDNNHEAHFDERDAESKSFADAPGPAPAGPAAPCPECRGSGRLVLLTSSRAFARCGGAGRLVPAGGKPEGTARGPEGPARTYDGHRRLTRLVWPEGQTDAAAPGARSCSLTYDEQGRLLTEEWAGPSDKRVAQTFTYPPFDLLVSARPCDTREGPGTGRPEPGEA